MKKQILVDFYSIKYDNKYYKVSEDNLFNKKRLIFLLFEKDYLEIKNCLQYNDDHCCLIESRPLDGTLLMEILYMTEEYKMMVMRRDPLEYKYIDMLSDEVKKSHNIN